MTPLELVKAGKREIVVSLIGFEVEKEYVRCNTLAEAAEILSRPMAAGWHRTLPAWQWLGDDGVYEFDPYGPEVDELADAIRALIPQPA